MKRHSSRTKSGIFILFVALSVSGCNKGAKSDFPAFPPKDVTSVMDRGQMLEQLGIKLPELPPIMNDPNAPKGIFPVNPANPDRWTDSARINNIERSVFGLWNNFSDKSSGMFPGPDSARVGVYTPIDLLKMKNGKTITTADEWWNKRRPEIVKDIEEQLYGKIPAESILPKVTWDVKTATGGVGNSAYIQKEVTGTIDISGYPEVRNRPVIRFTLRTSAKITEPSPVIIFFGGFGNALDMYWERCNPKGWGICVFDLTALQPDNGASLTSYLIGLVNKGNWRKPSDWGTLAAYSWGVGRIIDYFETDKDVNAKIIGLSGVSRYGKATIVSVAYEPRIAIGFPGDAGSLGTKMNRRHWGQDLENSTASNEYHWMAGTFFKWAGELHEGQYLPRKIENCPVDAHSLLALCAPRPMFFDAGSTSTWCDPYGVYLTTYNATPVYELLGKKGIVMNDPKPQVDKAYIGGTVGYRCHNGGHTDVPDWPAFLEFAAKQFDITTLSPSVSYLNIGPKAGSSATFDIVSNKEWTISGAEDWLKIDSETASGNKTVTVTVSANTDKNGRSSVLTIKTKGREQTVVVNQASLKPELEVAEKDIKIGETDKSTASINIKSNSAWNIAVAYENTGTQGPGLMGGGNWLTFSDDAGINTKTISVTASANPGVTKRAAKVTVAAAGVKPKIITISQTEGVPTLSIMTDSISLAAVEGSASIMIMSNTIWNLTCSEEWLSASRTTGGNFSQVAIIAKENTGTERKANVVVKVEGLAEKIITVKQAGK
jgi:hypothetical protein